MANRRRVMFSALLPNKSASHIRGGALCWRGDRSRTSDKFRPSFGVRPGTIGRLEFPATGLPPPRCTTGGGSASATLARRAIAPGRPAVAEFISASPRRVVKEDKRWLRAGRFDAPVETRSTILASPCVVALMIDPDGTARADEKPEIRVGQSPFIAAQNPVPSPTGMNPQHGRHYAEQQRYQGRGIHQTAAHRAGLYSQRLPLELRGASGHPHGAAGIVRVIPS